MLGIPKGGVPIYRDWTLLQLAALTLALDQMTKFVARQTLAWHYSWPADGFFRFTHVQNTGSAFGLFQGNNLPLLIVSLVGIVVLAYIYQSQRQPTRLLRVSIALMLGGAFGNLIDRIHQGHVTDFIDVGPWPVFNLADSAIVVGLITMGWLLIMRREKDTGNDDEPDDAPTPILPDEERRGEPNDTITSPLTGERRGSERNGPPT